MLMFPAALLAYAINLKRVPRGEVVVLAPDFFFQLAHFLGEELHRASAIGANHMVMAAPVVLMLVTRDAVMKRDLAGQAALRQQFQRAVDRGIADAGVFFLHQSVQFVGREMIPSFKESPQNRVALRRLLQPHTL